IFAVSSTSCIRSKMLSTYDLIMMFLSLSRFFLQSWIMLELSLGLFCQDCYYKANLMGTFKTVFVFLNYSSFWFAAWLSVFYCIKVASFTESFFVWLKQRISSLMPWMLITSSLFCLAASLPFSWDIYNMHNNFSTPLIKTSSSKWKVTVPYSFFSLIFVCNAGILLPFMIFAVSSVLLIRSLWKHTRQMQNNATGFRDPSLEAHIGAIRSIFSFLLLYLINFIALSLMLSGIFLPFSTEEAICMAIMAACPAAHSMVLIWSNPKFRKLPARI
ncbi:T2R40 protein, partial [Alectura lathami]|nr:T2R40 protein [Alectura lathami]